MDLPHTVHNLHNLDQSTTAHLYQVDVAASQKQTFSRQPRFVEG